MTPPPEQPMAPDPDAVADAYGLGIPLGLPNVAARGELGRIWRLETNLGTWAVKELLRFDPARVEADARRDVGFQEAAITAGIPMPHPVVARSGEVTTSIEAGDGPTRRVRVYTWVDLAGRDHVADLEDVAVTLGRLHALGLADDRPVDPWFAVAPEPDRWPDLLGGAEAQRVPWLPALAHVVPDVLETLAVIPEARMAAATTCHLDFNPENVLVDAGGRIVVVDWENSGAAPVEQELASAVAEFVKDPAAAPAFVAAYARAGGPAHLVDRSSFRMTVVVQANLVETYARRALDGEAPPEDRARSARWVEEIAANAFTVDRIDAWLAAVGRSRRAERAQLAT
jgi:Ser/Thr protein kinase RdoA (MazF antagonist)